MSDKSILLLGIGGAGCRIARGVSRAFGEETNLALADTDAASGTSTDNFTLLGGDRLSGHGAGGDTMAGRMAAEDSISCLDHLLEEVRLVVIVTALGGGTGCGATIEATKRLAALGVRSIVFATTPFAFEGEDRLRNARGAMSMISENANAAFYLPLDKLVSGEDNMQTALRRAIDMVASGVTLFWRLANKPGYIRLDTERILGLLENAGRGRFATITTQGPNRATEAMDAISHSELLSASNSPVRSILCGVLAGDDLRLSELSAISDGVRKTFGENCTFHLGTVNDEATFSGRLSVVIMLFEYGENSDSTNESKPTGVGPRRIVKHQRGVLGTAAMGRGRFNNAAPTVWNGEDLDTPTFIRRNINLEL